MKPRVAINGFGRIGRVIQRVNQKRKLLDIVAINDLSDTPTLAHLLKYDSSYGIFDGEVNVRDNHLMIDGKELRVFNEKDPSKLPWKEMNIRNASIP